MGCEPLGHTHKKQYFQSSMSHLKSISLSLMMYAQDYDEHLPPMGDSERVKTVLKPYLKFDEVWQIPPYEILYATNPSLSQKSLESIKSPAEIALVYEPIAGRNSRIVGFADGHVKSIRESQWPALRQKSGIPKLPEPTIAPWWRFDVKGPHEPLDRSATFTFCIYLGLGLVLLAALLRLRYAPITFWQGVGQVVLHALGYLVLTSSLGFFLGLFFLSHR
jgi:prepilin-type processing-associated H-X9-DG protein